MQTQKEKLNNMFYGLYMIIPGQFTLLDNQYLSFSKKNLKIIVQSSPNTVYNYSINSIDQLYYRGAPIKAIEVKLDNLATTNATGSNNISNLLTMGLGMRPPTIIYMTYDNETGLFSLKNQQRSNILTLQRISD